jgi:hypothetical protein
MNEIEADYTDKGADRADKIGDHVEQMIKRTGRTVGRRLSIVDC